MTRTFTAAHVNIPDIAADIATIEPPTITQDELLDRLMPALGKAHARGVTAEQIRDRLAEHGIRIPVADVRRFLEGKAARKTKAAAAPTRMAPVGDGVDDNATDDRQAGLPLTEG